MRAARAVVAPKRGASRLSECATTFRALDDLLLDGVARGTIRLLPREELHCALIFALFEAAEAQQSESSDDWLRDAAMLFLARVATCPLSSRSTAPVAVRPGGRAAAATASPASSRRPRNPRSWNPLRRRNSRSPWAAR